MFSRSGGGIIRHKGRKTTNAKRGNSRIVLSCSTSRTSRDLTEPEDCIVSKQGLVQPMVSLIEETGLFMGTSLVDTTKTLIPVTLLNPGEETKQLPRGLPVGVVEQVEETSVRRDKGTPIQESNVKHLADMLNRMGSGLSSEQARQVKDIVMAYRDVFATPDGELIFSIQ